MPVLTASREEQDLRLDHSCNWLWNEAPELSGRDFLTQGQWISAAAIFIMLVVGIIVSPASVAVSLVGLATVFYVAILANRVWLTVRSLRRPNVVHVSDEEARSLSDDDLPLYTVLVPIYREAAMIPQLLSHLRALEYPRDRLDVKLLIEADDPTTADALVPHDLGDFEVLVVPVGGPRTKPKALNYGLTFARGDFVTIYDAEDRPDPLQLRKVVAAFGRLPSQIGCLQAKLEYWNSEQNLITKWFGAEYVQWFRLILPGLAAGDNPVPLGGTSNHIRRALLVAIGGWDPYNVTEDADLGIRLHRAGYRCAVLDSITWEEANSDYVNWNRQRSRWYKGYLQTWLVHMRRPFVLLNELGSRGWLQFTASVGGTPILSLFNLVFWALTIAWFVGHVGLVKLLFPAALYYPALLCFVLGNVTFAYIYIVSARLSNQPSLVWAACLVPVYWLMMGVAAVKALWQLFIDRSFWEKTVHGLARAEQPGDLTDAGRWAPTVAPAFFARPDPPVLAKRIADSRTSLAPHWRDWRRAIVPLGKLLQIVALALFVCVLYSVVISGVGDHSPAAGHLLDEPLARLPLQGATIARLTIPAVDLDDLVLEGTSPGSLGTDLGHLSGTALPGSNGDAVVVGHRFADGRALASLVDVHVGDQVLVYVGGGSARYRVVSTSSQGGRSLVLAPPWVSALTILTGGNGLDPDSLFVVRADLVSKSGVRFVGAELPPARQVDVPGMTVGKLFIACLWLAAALVAFQLARLARARWQMRWVSALLGAISFLLVFAMCVAASHGLPITF